LIVRYLYSACVVIESPDVRMLCDPWFTPGVYDGSWFQWPLVEDPISTIGPVDLIFISHIHPDHYDPIFLRKYLAAYPDARIVAGRHAPPILNAKLAADGFEFTVVDHCRHGETDIWILPNRTRAVNIDSALVVRRQDQAVANLNDCPFDEPQVERIRELCAGARMMALIPYGGATVHPQAFIFENEDDLVAAGRAKERHFLDIFHRYIEALSPDAVLPFAGKHWLGGPLMEQNQYRGIPDPVVAAREAGERAVVLADGGKATFDLDTMTASAVRTEPYDRDEVERYLLQMPFPGYAYEREIKPDPERELPILPLLNVALARARAKTPIADPCWVIIHATGTERSYVFDVSSDAPASVREQSEDFAELHPRFEIFIDNRYLFGILSRMYHWNNAQIGSHFKVRRVPDVFRREIFDFFDFLQV
jgi:UDP-MurNAc hydroxylase